jgi:hypothetical protein
MEQNDFNDILKGMYFEMNEDKSEFIVPPTEQFVVSTETKELTDELNEAEFNNNCSWDIVVTDEGDIKRAKFYITNKSNKYASLTIIKQFVYRFQLKQETVRLRLYPGQKLNVLNIFKAQNPKVIITHCNLDENIY